MADATAYFLRSGDAKPAYHKIVYIWSFEFVPLLRRSGQSCQLVSSLVHML
jgi:hypothetical protein